MQRRRNSNDKLVGRRTAAAEADSVVNCKTQSPIDRRDEGGREEGRAKRLHFQCAVCRLVGVVSGVACSAEELGVRRRIRMPPHRSGFKG